MKTCIHYFVYLILFAGVFAGGCFRQNVPPDLPNLIPCSITITQDNVPLAGADVVLEPVDADSKWLPGGLTDATGTARLLTNGRYKGAPEGSYKVTVRKQEQEPSKLSPQPPADSPEYMKWVDDYGKEVRHSYSLVEVKFGNSETTPFELAISGNKTVSASFDVGKPTRTQLKYRPPGKD